MTRLPAPTYGKSADTIKFVTDDNGDITKAYIIDKTVSQIVSLTLQQDQSPRQWFWRDG